MIRAAVPGHLQRGGSPNPFDRILATRYGVHGIGLVAAGKWGRMAALPFGLARYPGSAYTRARAPASGQHPVNAG